MHYKLRLVEAMYIFNYKWYLLLVKRRGWALFDGKLPIPKHHRLSCVALTLRYCAEFQLYSNNCSLQAHGYDKRPLFTLLICKKELRFGFPTPSTQFIGYEMLLKITEKISMT